MTLPAAFQNSDRSRTARTAATLGGRDAFTMVEIALSLAIIGLGMIAIIGVLPRGMQVQRENRQETIINQDAVVWLSAIRSGARGYDDLTNYVDSVTKVVTDFDINGNIEPGYPVVHVLTPTSYSINGTPQPPLAPNNIFDGARIVGMLSTPKVTRFHDLRNHIVAESNYVTAYVHPMSGAASEKFPQANASVRELAFSYRMVSEVVPYTGWDTNMVQYPPGLSAAEIAARRNYWLVARNTHTNLHDLRLLFRWPLLPQGRTGEGRQAFRASVGGQLVATDDLGLALYFFDPSTYVRNNP